MPTSLPMPTKAVGDVFTTTLWNSNLRDNLNKLLNTGHRVLTVAQFAALSSPEGTKGTVAPDEVYLEVDATNGVLWHLAYESGEATYKWRFLGGPPLYSEVTAAESTTSSTYAALATAGPSIALPRAGDYDVRLEVEASLNNTGVTAASYDIGATGAVDADAANFNFDSANRIRYGCSSRRKAALTTETLTAKYKTSAATTFTVQNRRMTVRPVRVRHDA